MRCVCVCVNQTTSSTVCPITARFRGFLHLTSIDQSDFGWHGMNTGSLSPFLSLTHSLALSLSLSLCLFVSLSVSLSLSLWLPVSLSPLPPTPES